MIRIGESSFLLNLEDRLRSPCSASLAFFLTFTTSGRVISFSSISSVALDIIGGIEAVSLGALCFFFRFRRRNGFALATLSPSHSSSLDEPGFEYFRTLSFDLSLPGFHFGSKLPLGASQSACRFLLG